jgi:hypothetical protein
LQAFKVHTAKSTAAVVLLATLVVGCARWKNDPSQSTLKLPAVRENTRSVILEVEFLPIKVDVEDPGEDATIWQWVDETAVDAAERSRLIANGLRIGRIINVDRFRSRIDALAPTRDVVDQFLSGASVASEVSHNAKRVPMRLGRRWELQLRQPIEGDHVTMLRLDEDTIGRTLSDPQYLFAMVATAGESTGEVNVRLRPEIQHGAMRQKWVSSDAALRIDTRRETWSIKQLDVNLSGMEGDTFVVAAAHPAAGLASQMLGGTNADNLPQQVMVVIRIDQIPSPVDDL